MQQGSHLSGGVHKIAKQRGAIHNTHALPI